MAYDNILTVILTIVVTIVLTALFMYLFKTLRQLTKTLKEIEETVKITKKIITRVEYSYAGVSNIVDASSKVSVSLLFFRKLLAFLGFFPKEKKKKS